MDIPPIEFDHQPKPWKFIKNIICSPFRSDMQHFLDQAKHAKLDASAYQNFNEKNKHDADKILPKMRSFTKRKK